MSDVTSANTGGPVPVPAPRPGPPQTADQRAAGEVAATVAELRALSALDADATTPDDLQARIAALTSAHDTLRAQLSTLGR